MIGRFINADSYTDTGTGFLGYNMFAYCNNSPILFADSRGDRLYIADYTRDAGQETEVTANDIFKLLRSLTDDVIVLVNGEVRILKFQEGRRPKGTALLRELICSGKKFTIKDLGTEKKPTTKHLHTVKPVE